jgi:hypothetical protein
MYKKIIFSFLFGATPFLAYASMAKEGSEKDKVVTLAAASAAAGSAGSAAAQKPYNRAIVCARLIQYVERGDILGVKQQLAKCPNPYANGLEANFVMHKAMNNHLTVQQKSRAEEYLAIAVMLAKARDRSPGGYENNDHMSFNDAMHISLLLPDARSVLNRVLNYRLIEAVEQADVMRVERQLFRGAQPHAVNQEGEPVLHTAIDGWLNDKKGKDKEYCEITIALMKAGATLQFWQGLKSISADVIKCLPTLVDYMPTMYRQTMYDAQGNPGWLHEFLAKTMESLEYAISMKEKKDGDLERDCDAEAAIRCAVMAILDSGFDIVTDTRANPYAKLKRWDFYLERIDGKGDLPRNPRERHSIKRKRKNTFATIEEGHEIFVLSHQKVLKEGLLESLPDAVLDLVYECLYIRPYECKQHRIPMYIQDLLAITLPENGDREAVGRYVALMIRRYGRLGGLIPHTPTLIALAHKQGSKEVQETLAVNARDEALHDQIFKDSGPFCGKR